MISFQARTPMITFAMNKSNETINVVNFQCTRRSFYDDDPIRFSINPPPHMREDFQRKYGKFIYSKKKLTVLSKTQFQQSYQESLHHQVLSLHRKGLTLHRKGLSLHRKGLSLHRTGLSLHHRALPSCKLAISQLTLLEMS